MAAKNDPLSNPVPRNAPLAGVGSSVADFLSGIGKATNALDPKNLINPKTTHHATVHDLVTWAGWKGDDADTATAVFLCEGGGLIKPDGTLKCECNAFGCCAGLIQASVKDCPKGVHDISKADACDYAKGAKWAYNLWQSQGFQPWECYTTGLYKAQMGKDKTIAFDKGTFGGGTSQEGPGGVDLPSIDVGGAIRKLAETISKIFDVNTWLRVLKVGGGGIFLILGLATILWIMARPILSATPGVTGKVARTTSNVARTQKAAKTIKANK